MKKITKLSLVAGLLVSSLSADEIQSSSIFNGISYNATAQYGSSGIVGGEVSAVKHVYDRVAGVASVKYLDYNSDGHSLKGSIKAYYALTEKIFIGGGPGILYTKTYEKKVEQVRGNAPAASSPGPSHSIVVPTIKEANYMTKAIAEASIAYGINGYGYINLNGYIHNFDNFNINIEAPIITYNTDFGVLNLGIYAESTVIDSQTINHAGVLLGVTF